MSEKKSKKRNSSNAFDNQTSDEKCETVIETEAYRWINVRLVKINEISNEVCYFVTFILHVKYN